MKRNRFGCAYIVLLTIVALSGCGRSHGWSGTWQLNASKSSIPGSAFSISMTPTGEYHEDDGVMSYNFACNGKDYSTSAKHTISCVQKTALIMDTIATQSGEQIGNAHWELSGDGKTLTIVSTLVQSTGPAKPTEISYERTSGSGGFVGGWKNMKLYDASPHTLQLTENAKQLHILYPESGQYTDATLDGSDATMHGPTVPDGLTISLQPEGAEELLTLSKYKGTIVNQGSLRMSEDRRSLLEEFWRPGSNQKAHLVYEKR